ncbi:MAG TPA: hypothetical protein VJ482_05540 [Acidimicrobiia bacterium]|nr:hypothetical protein [Acidimicrobiia bacterium]
MRSGTPAEEQGKLIARQRLAGVRHPDKEINGLRKLGIPPGRSVASNAWSRQIAWVRKLSAPRSLPETLL